MAGVESPTLRAVKARLGSVRLLLQECTGTDAFESFSRIQSNALLGLLQKASLEPEDRASLAEQIMSMPLAETDKASLMSVLAADGSSERIHKRRRALQNYMQLTNYVPDSIWDVLTSEEL